MSLGWCVVAVNVHLGDWFCVPPDGVLKGPVGFKRTVCDLTVCGLRTLHWWSGPGWSLTCQIGVFFFLFDTADVRNKFITWFISGHCPTPNETLDLYMLVTWLWYSRIISIIACWQFSGLSQKTTCCLQIVKVQRFRWMRTFSLFSLLSRLLPDSFLFIDLLLGFIWSLYVSQLIYCAGRFHLDFPMYSTLCRSFLIRIL